MHNSANCLFCNIYCSCCIKSKYGRTLSFAVGIRGLPVAFLAAALLTYVYEKVVVASSDGRNAVLIAGSATFFGSVTFSARRLNFSVGNRGLPELGSFHIVYLISLCYHVEDC